MRTKTKSRRPRQRPAKPRIKQKAVANLEAEMLRLVRANQNLSRVSVARQLGLAPSTAGAYVDRLISEGFLLERQKPQRDFGRPPTLLSLNPAGGRFIGVDFEAHNIMGTAVDFSQQPINQIHRTILPADSVETIIGKIEQTIEELIGDHASEVLGIGVAVPGFMDPKTQIALYYKHIKGWENIPLGKLLTQRFSVNVFLENNIRAMALAELWFGQGRGLENFVCLGVRTGISAALVIQRDLFHGKDNLAGEIGGWLCPADPVVAQAEAGRNSWSCRALRTFEEIASVPAIMKDYHAAALTQEESTARNREAPVSSQGEPSFDQVVAAAQASDPAVGDVLGRVAQTLGWAVCQIDSLFNPDKIILAGPLVKLGDALLNPLQQALRKFCSELRSNPPSVVNSELGSFNGALGAAALAMHQWKPKR